MKYKLEVYQNNFPNFICGSPTNTKILGQDEDAKVGPSGIAQEEEMQIEEPKEFKSGAAQKEEIQIEKPQDLRKGG